MKRSVTIVELIISMVLLGVIVLGASAFNFSANRFLTSSEKKTQVLNDLTFVLQHLHKNIILGTGDIVNSGITIPATRRLAIRQDLNSSGTPNYTPSNYSDDRTVVYAFGVVGSSYAIMFSNNNGTTWEVLTRSLVSSSLVINLVDGEVEIKNLSLRLDPSSPADSRHNPEVSTQDLLGKTTVYFHPLAQSWK